ncbi:GLPGLI family protein [Flavobacterium silvaticum]|uniref:GLPGLI family protein n=1 Tax=Flavobacterium silvaticum TaxID=1852020 RepID=A0A972JHM9_9FLAO|nr:GLPGLI family protein [Flavobacterium silvaticum]NMH27298.1 GLPGLI family protein [Flavobacterium silvaticum]
MKEKILFVLLLLHAFLHAQKVKVHYDSYLIDLKDEFGGINIISADLITDTNEALYISTTKDTVFTILDSGEYSSKKSDPFFLYKKLKTQEACYFGQSVHKNPVKDTDYKINWQIGKETKTLLGYHCNQAVCQWRGRSYTAFYTPDIPISSGPYKFDGLPGIILEINSEDKEVRIIARAITRTEEKITNPFSEKQTISWQEFLKLYKKKFEDFRNLSLGEHTTQTIPKRYIETYVE